MRVLGILLLLVGIAGALMRLLLISGSGDYNPLVGGLVDQPGNTPGASRMEWEDQRSTDTLWLWVWGGTAILGAILLAAAPKESKKD